jgi:deoxyhypusine synthase
MNRVAHSHYERVPHYRDLTPSEERDLLDRGLNRVTDTCIPEEEAFRKLQHHIHKVWSSAEAKGERYFPHEYMYQMIRLPEFAAEYDSAVDPANSWMLAAAERNLPIIVPGWEDSTMGNIFASYVIKSELKASTMKSGIEYMAWLADWYVANCRNPKNPTAPSVGFFQIGGGIAGDFPICVVPMIRLRRTVRTAEQFRTKRSPGASSTSTHQNLLSSLMLQSLPRLCLRGYSNGDLPPWKSDALSLTTRTLPRNSSR